MILEQLFSLPGLLRADAKSLGLVALILTLGACGGGGGGGGTTTTPPPPPPPPPPISGDDARRAVLADIGNEIISAVFARLRRRCNGAADGIGDTRRDTG